MLLQKAKAGYIVSAHTSFPYEKLPKPKEILLPYSNRFLSFEIEKNYAIAVSGKINEEY